MTDSAHVPRAAGSEPRRLGLYGGTFDPVHDGHLAVARSMVTLFRLDEVLLVPAHVAPHKRTSRVTPALHRYAMLALATRHDEALRVSTLEIDCPERPFTIETVGRVQQERGAGWRTFFVMGTDSWVEIETWHEWGRLLSMTDTVVVTRPGSEVWGERWRRVPAEAARRVVDVRGMDADAVAAISSEPAAETRVYLTDAVRMDVAATKVRESARTGGTSAAGGSVPPEVAEYIKKYGLYKDGN